MISVKSDVLLLSPPPPPPSSSSSGLLPDGSEDHHLNQCWLITYHHFGSVIIIWGHVFSAVLTFTSHPLSPQLPHPQSCIYTCGDTISKTVEMRIVCRADSRFAPCQWQMVLLCNDISFWLGASLESAPVCLLQTKVDITLMSHWASCCL